ncbi:MAG: DUF1015 domain-containing protein [Thermoleophilia bacterium]
MAHVISFRGLRYNQETIPDMSAVVSPPYDVITPVQQQVFLDRHPQNAIHIDYGPKLPGDDDTDNRYTRAAADLYQWLRQKTLLPEAEPALYFLREEFTGPDGRPAIREGFFAAVRLAEFSEGIILPHEETASGPKADRLHLMEATGANLSAIFCLYPDPELKVAGLLRAETNRTPDISLTDDAGTGHSLWVITGEPASLVSAAFHDKSLLIADGHHRYETALTYRNARRQKEDPGEDTQPYDYLMVYLSPMEDSSQSILPIHRLVKGLSPETMADLPALLKKDFELEEITGTAAESLRTMVDRQLAAGEERNAFGIYLPAAGQYYIAISRLPRPVLDAARYEYSDAWRSLEVSVLDKLILQELLGITPGGANTDARITFVERTDKALEEAEAYDAAFFVNATSMAEIKAVAEAGEKMPQKSTYFHPKPLTGLVFRSFLY